MQNETKNAIVRRIDDKVTTLVSRHFGKLVAICSALYVSLASVAIQRRPLWFDEIDTALLSKLPYRNLWSALVSGADSNPFFFYVPPHLLFKITERPELAIRIPASLFWVLGTVCIYFLSLRYVSRVFALFACFVPFLTIAGSYSTEGRAYASTIGCLALALLSWRNAHSSEKAKPIWSVILLLSLAAAIGGHYAATIIIPALVAGEGVFAFETRKLHWPTVTAITVGVLGPLLAARPFLPAIHAYLLSFWSRPTLYEFLQSWVEFVAWRRSSAIILIVLLAYLFLRRSPQDQLQFPRIERSELAVWMVLLTAPIQGYLQGLISGGFTIRYALPMVISLAILTTVGCYRITQDSSLAGLSLIFLGLICCASYLLTGTKQPSGDQIASKWISRQPGIQPLIIGDPLLFSSMFYYSKTETPNLKFAYLSSPRLSTRYLGMNSPDLNLSELRKFVPMPVYDYDSFIQLHRHFTLFHGRWDWTLEKLHNDRAITKKIACTNDDKCLYDVELTH